MQLVSFDIRFTITFQAIYSRAAHLPKKKKSKLKRLLISGKMSHGWIPINDWKKSQKYQQLLPLEKNLGKKVIKTSLLTVWIQSFMANCVSKNILLRSAFLLLSNSFRSEKPWRSFSCSRFKCTINCSWLIFKTVGRASVFPVVKFE